MVLQRGGCALQRQTAHALERRRGSGNEGSEASPTRGAIARELRNLHRCARMISRGSGIDRALDSAAVWDKRKALYKQTLSRLNEQALATLLLQAQDIDLSFKGQKPGAPWELLEQLICQLAGQPLAIGVARMR